MIIRQTKYLIAAAILICLAVSSCSYTDVDMSTEDAVSSVSLSITASPFGTSTRAYFEDSEITENPASANELIHHWIVAFFSDGKEVAVVEGTPGSGGTSGATGVWNDRVKVELPKGTYDVLAFANLDNAAIREHLENINLEEDWEDHIYAESLQSLDNSLVPMSGYRKGVTIKGTVNEEFAVEVVRMFAKVEYAVKNLSSQEIKVNTFSITPIYDGDIYLFPEYTKKPVPNNEPNYKPRFPQMTDGLNHYGTRTETARSTFILSANSTDIERGNFYIKESVAAGNHPTNRFHIGMNLTRGISSEDVTYALADVKLEYIYRNDYILFPIVITDYVPEFEVSDYPPIGGYPVQVESNATEFYATFSSSGAFDILARLRDSKGATIVLQPYDGTDTQNNYVRYVSSDPAGFKLTYDKALGLWQADFQQGDQRVVLTFEFKIGNLIYTRTLYLLSK